MAAKIKVDLNTGNIYVSGIKHNRRGIAQQAADGVAFDPDQGVFRFRDDAFNREWLANKRVTLVVKE